MSSTFSRGDRVILVATGDPFTRLEAGATGHVTYVDDLGTVHVRWDDGRHLGLIPGEDDFKLEPEVN